MKRSTFQTTLPVPYAGSDGAQPSVPLSGSTDVSGSASVPDIITGELDAVMQYKSSRLRNEFMRIHLRHLCDARIHSVSL